MSNGNSSAPAAPGPVDRAAWSDTFARYRRSSAKRALWQLATTLLPYLLLWWVSYHAAAISLWLTIPPAVLAGAFLMRLFIIFHDCGHGSYFASRWANDIVGSVTGALTVLAPFYLFLIDHRFASRNASERQRRSVHWMNVVFVGTGCR